MPLCFGQCYIFLKTKKIEKTKERRCRKNIQKTNLELPNFYRNFRSDFHFNSNPIFRPFPSTFTVFLFSFSCGIIYFIIEGYLIFQICSSLTGKIYLPHTIRENLTFKQIERYAESVDVQWVQDNASLSQRSF